VEFDCGQSAITVQVRGRTYPVRIWNGRVDTPLDGTEFGVDTETLLIEGPVKLPDMVIMQVFNGISVDIVTWDKVDLYLRLLEKHNKEKILLYFLNAPFDIRVINSTTLHRMLANDQVIDVGSRHRLYKLATQGYFEEPVSLANLCRLYLHQELDKPEDIRMGFTRDMVLTAADVRYAALDAVVTLLIAREMPEQPTEALQAKADLVLDLIKAAGIKVDKPAWDAHKQSMQDRYVVAADVLRTHGFEPDSNANKPGTLLGKFCSAMGIDAPPKVWSVTKLKGILYVMYAESGGTLEHACSELKIAMPAIVDKKFKMTKKNTQDLTACLAKHDMVDLISTRKSRPFTKVLLLMAELMKEGNTYKAVMAETSKQYNAAGGWEDDSAFKGPTAFVQDHLKKLQAVHGITFAETPGGKIKMSKDEAWRLESKGIKDEFLEAYIDYKHIEKILGTYLNDEFIYTDGRVHARFNIMVKTGRTSCSKPNLQNLPKADGIRELFTVEDGKVMVSIDYNQLELCSLAQHCHKEYGVSRMRELINAEIDLHSWFAGRKLRHITPENDYDGTEVSRVGLLPILKNIKDTEDGERSKAKAANFGQNCLLLPKERSIVA